MKKLIIALLLLLPTFLNAQIYTKQPWYGLQVARILPDSTLYVPLDTNRIRDNISSVGQMRWNRPDNSLYVNNGVQWINVSGSGGGGGGTNLPSLNVGTTPTVVGNLLNESFPGTSIPSGWTNTGASVTYNNKLIVSSGSGSPTNFGQFLQNGFFNYDKQAFRTVVIPQSKTSTSFGVGYTFSQNAQFFSLSTTAYLNLTNGVDSGRVFVNGVGSTNMSFNTGDTIEFSLIVDGWNVTAQAFNRRNNQRVTATQLTAQRLGTGGRFRLCFLGGAQDITNVRIDSWNRIGGLAVIGDSHTSGIAATQESNMYVSRLVNGDLSRVSNYGYPSITGGNIGGFSWMLSAWQNLKAQQPTQAVIAIGYNDASQLGADTATFRTSYRIIIDSLLSIGVRPILTTLVPRPTVSPVNTVNYNTVINSLGSIYGLKVANVFGALADGTNRIRLNYLANDFVHMSDSGHIVMANTIRNVAPEIFAQFVPDTTSNVTMQNIPVGSVSDELLVIDSRNRVRKIANLIPSSVITNNIEADANYVQRASIGITGELRTESAAQIYDSVGLRINFNGGNRYGLGTAGTNVVISNTGTSGTGFPARYGRINGTRNLLWTQVTDRANGIVNINGNNNLLLKYNHVTLDSLNGSNNIVLNANAGRLANGSGNILIGNLSASTLTTGSNNIILNTGVSDATMVAANLSTAIIIGDVRGEAATTGDVIFNTERFTNQNYWFGGRSNDFSAGRTITMNAPARTDGTNSAGPTWTFRAGRGTGSGESGVINFQSSTPVGSGTTVHTAYTTTLQLTRTKINANVQIDNSTATRGILPPRWATGGRPASPALGEMGYNTTDNKLEYWNGTLWIQL